MNRNTLYRLQDVRQKFSWCPCGFFCKDCLREMIDYEGMLRGIFWHIIFHTPLGKIYFQLELKKPIEGIASSEVYEMIID